MGGSQGSGAQGFRASRALGFSSSGHPGLRGSAPGGSGQPQHKLLPNGPSSGSSQLPSRDIPEPCGLHTVSWASEDIAPPILAKPPMKATHGAPDIPRVAESPLCFLEEMASTGGEAEGQWGRGESRRAHITWPP